MKVKVILVIALVMVLAAACAPAAAPTPTPTTPPTTVLTIAGSGTGTAILSAVKAQFEAATPGYQLELLTGTGTSGGVKGVIEGTIDIVAMNREPKEEETAQKLAFTLLGQVSHVLFVHPDVKITDLTAEQAKAIFMGEITNWQEVGGDDAEIVVYVRDEDDGSTKSLRQTVFGDEPFPETGADRVLTSQGDMQTAVADTAHSIGFGSWQAALANQAKIHFINLDGVTPDDPAYPAQSPLGIGYLSDQQAKVQPFIDWLLSDTGTAALQEFKVSIP